MERGHHAVRERERRDAIRQTERRQRRRTVGLARQRGEAAHRFGDRAEAGALRVRAELTEPGHTREDEPRVLRREAVVPEVPALERPGPEVLDDDVRAARDASEQSLAVGGREIERRESLVPADDLPPQTDAILARSVMPRRIPLHGMFDLEYVRAEVAEERRGQRSGEQRRDLDDLETGERVG